MKGAVLYEPGDIRFEDRETPKIIEQRTRCSASRRPACADRTCGRTGACSQSTVRRRWAMSIAASSQRSAARLNPLSRDAGRNIPQ